MLRFPNVDGSPWASFTHSPTRLRSGSLYSLPGAPLLFMESHSCISKPDLLSEHWSHVSYPTSISAQKTLGPLMQSQVLQHHPSSPPAPQVCSCLCLHHDLRPLSFESPKPEAWESPGYSQSQHTPIAPSHGGSPCHPAALLASAMQKPCADAISFTL